MRKALAFLLAGVLMGTLAASYAKLPPAPPKTDAQKKAEADKDAATKAKDAADLAKAMDRAVANSKHHAPAKGAK